MNILVSKMKKTTNKKQQTKTKNEKKRYFEILVLTLGDL